jgi:hypothetical protein
MPLYNANDILDKTLYAKKSVNVYSAPNNLLTPLYVVTPGNIVGVVYSWVKKNDIVYWHLYDNTFVTHDSDKFSLEKLQEQGAQSTEEKLEAEAEANMPWYEKLTKTATKTLITIAIIGAAAAIITKRNK